MLSKTFRSPLGLLCHWRCFFRLRKLLRLPAGILPFLGNQLPYPRNKRFGKDARGAVDWLIGGWQTNGIMTPRTGAPIRITASSTAGIFGSAT